MTITGLERIVGGHPLFAGLPGDFLKLVSGCARNAVFRAGEHLLQEGEPAEEIFLVRSGRVALEITAPGHGRMTFQTAGAGAVVGLSWLVPPYRWTFDARALEDSRVVAINAECLRVKCEADAGLGYEVMKRFMPTVVRRLHDTRLQLLDVYGGSN